MVCLKGPSAVSREVSKTSCMGADISDLGVRAGVRGQGNRFQTRHIWEHDPHGWLGLFLGDPSDWWFSFCFPVKQPLKTRAQTQSKCARHFQRGTSPTHKNHARLNNIFWTHSRIKKEASEASSQHRSAPVLRPPLRAEIPIIRDAFGKKERAIHNSIPCMNFLPCLRGPTSVFPPA